MGADESQDLPVVSWRPSSLTQNWCYSSSPSIKAQTKRTNGLSSSPKASRLETRKSQCFSMSSKARKSNVPVQRQWGRKHSHSLRDESAFLFYSGLQPIGWMLSRSLLSWLFETVWSTLIEHSPPGSPVLGVLQVRTLEWVAIPFLRGSSWPRDWTWVYCTVCGSFTIWATRERGPPNIKEGHWFSQSTNSNIQFSSITQLCPTICNSMDGSTPGFPVHRQLPELAQIHVHQVSDAFQQSHTLSSASPPDFNLSQNQGLFQWVSSLHQVAKVLEFQLQHQSFQWIFRTRFLQDWLVWSPCCPRDSQESSPIPQFKSINSSVLSFFYSPTFTSIHGYWKNHSFD